MHFDSGKRCFETEEINWSQNVCVEQAVRCTIHSGWTSDTCNEGDSLKYITYVILFSGEERKEKLSSYSKF
jgi:hypothetical protein